MQELKPQATELDLCGRTEPGVLTKAGRKDSVTLCQLSD